MVPLIRSIFYFSEVPKVGRDCLIAWSGDSWMFFAVVKLISETDFEVRSLVTLADFVLSSRVISIVDERI